MYASYISRSFEIIIDLLSHEYIFIIIHYVCQKLYITIKVVVS